MKPIYLDHAAATPLAPEALKAMRPYFSDICANPSSIHHAGQMAKEAVEHARTKVAALLHCLPEEIIFTSGGTESINLALKGLAFAKEKGHIITSQIEHPAVLEPCRHLQKQGFDVTYLPVNSSGEVAPQDVKNALRKDTILISIMYANNEIGTIQRIEEMGTIAQKQGIPFHTDACQAGNLSLDTNALKADMVSLNGSKIYGPKSCGLLYKKKSLRLEPLLHGGGQEGGLRSGTENVPGIVGFAVALELVQRNREKEAKRLRQLEVYCIKTILTKIPESALLGHPTQRLPGLVCIAFKGIEAETLVRHLSIQGVFVSSGSACTSQSIETSHVLQAIKAPYQKGSIRLSLGKGTTKKELKKALGILSKTTSSLRKITGW